ncbi:hypothetical protein NC652_020480 [Populus alba x Populus x berolinensis]|nr:hypothetical protein NC652_020480 [Populus alba x Populus x berolinensis]
MAQGKTGSGSIIEGDGAVLVRKEHRRDKRAMKAPAQVAVRSEARRQLITDKQRGSWKEDNLSTTKTS